MIKKLGGRLRGLIRREPTPRHLRPVMATEGMITVREAAALYELARQVTDGVIVEVGSYRGQSTAALGLGSMAGTGVPVFAVEPHEPFTGVIGGQFGPEDRGAFYRTMLRTGCYKVVRLINLSSEQVTSAWQKEVGLLWLDGDHSVEGVRRDLDCWWPHLPDGAVVAFDDSRKATGGPAIVLAEEVAAGRLGVLKKIQAVTLTRVSKP